MKNVPDSADVQMSACMAISNLAPAVGNHYGSSGVGWNNFCGIDMSLVSSSPSHDSPVISSGAITSIISAMEKHPQHKKLQEHACAALLNISTLGKLEVKAVSSSNGISMLLAAMINHQQVVEIQANACGALANLAAVLENRETIESKGGIYLFVCAMTAHRTEREVQKNGCAALRIVMEDGLFLETLQELGNVRKILEIASIDFPLECKVNADFLLKTLNNGGSSPSAYFVW
uniref:Armadillo repeat-containing domain-containing protein n=1 Tax=Proboscia inermis TaxID=420281 RepID=A0A7S0CC88_9STRA